MSEPAKNLNQALLAAMERYAERACFLIKQDGPYQGVTYSRFRRLAFRLAHFFRQQGISEGERVALIAPNSLEWMVTYAAGLLAGGVVTPLRITQPPEVLHFLLKDSGAALAVVHDRQQSQIILNEPETLPHLKTVVVIQDSGETRSGLIPLSAILSIPLKPKAQEAVRTQAESLPPTALAAINYTSGETGKVKGAVFDHDQWLAAMRCMANWLTLDEDDVAFTIRPWSESHGNLAAALHYFLSGTPNALVASYETVQENVQETSPTVMLSAPYTVERFYEGFMDWVSQQPESSQEVVHWALAMGKEYRAAGSTASEELQERFARADMTFFSRFRGEIGGRFRRFYSTGATLSRKLAEFMEAIGLLALNVYSITEAGGFPAVSWPENHRLGSCGQVTPGYEIRIAEDGEVLVRGQTIMREYWQDPEATREVIDAEGWLHTGDLGHFDDDGFLYLTGRKQQVMVLSTSRKVMPGPIEKALMASPFIDQAVVLGDGRPYISALLVPNLVALSEHFQEELPEDGDADQPEPTVAGLNWFWQQEADDSTPVIATAHPRVKALLDTVVGEINGRLDRWEQIRKYSLLDQAYSKAANELAELMPAGRQLIVERYTAEIESMYPQAPQLEEKEITQVQVSPERMRELLEKESILDAWLADAGIQFLFDLARAKQIDVPSMVNICDTAAAIAQMESEEKPLSTAFIVGDPTRITRVLPRSEIRLLQGDHIRRMRNQVITLARMVDGMVLGYVVDKHGYVRGIRRLRFDRTHFETDLAPDEESNLLLGPQFRQRAAISKLCNAVVFFVPVGGRQVRVFADGHLVGRYSNGDWSPDTMEWLDNFMMGLAGQKNYDLALVQRVLRCAFQMSEENLGAIFIVGDADVIMEHSDAPEISHFALIVSANIEQLTNRELINFAKQDGATVVDVQGKFRGCMVLLRPGAETKAEIGPGKGARHSSAAKMSAEARCLAIAVSQDGPITIYDGGKRVLSL